MTAALLLAFAWAASLQSWLIFDGVTRSLAYAGLDFVLALIFLFMSRGKWFPAPLFFLHAALVIYHLAAGVAGLSAFWVGALMNRAFDAALFYVIGCGLFAIFARVHRNGN